MYVLKLVMPVVRHRYDTNSVALIVTGDRRISIIIKQIHYFYSSILTVHMVGSREWRFILTDIIRINDVATVRTRISRSTSISSLLFFFFVCMPNAYIIFYEAGYYITLFHTQTRKTFCFFHGFWSHDLRCDPCKRRLNHLYYLYNIYINICAYSVILKIQNWSSVYVYTFITCFAYFANS